MAERPHLGSNLALVGKGIVLGHAAIVMQADDLAEIGDHVLRRRELLALAGTDVEITAWRKGDAIAAEMTAAAHLGHLAPDRFQAFELAATLVIGQQLRACDRGAEIAVVPGFYIAEVNRPRCLRTSDAARHHRSRPAHRRRLWARR